MKIYVTHASAFDFKNELYLPLRQSSLNTKHEITLPHEKSGEQFNSKEYLKDCDLVIAEVSFPSVGQGIELGWADLYQVPILCLYREGTKYSGALTVVSKDFVQYAGAESLVSEVEKFISQKF